MSKSFNTKRKRPLSSSTSLKDGRKNDYEIESDEEDSSHDFDVELSSEEDSLNDKKSFNDNVEEDESVEDETADSKRIRLAREYLEKVQRGDVEDSDSSADSDEEEDKVGKRLEKERLKSQNLHHQKVAADIETFKEKSVKYWSRAAHDLSPTCLTLHSSNEHAYSASKDHSLVKWNVETESIEAVMVQHWKKSSLSYTPRNKGEILALASSDDNRYLATGGRDSLIHIYDIRTLEQIQSFSGHKESITSLCFQPNSLDLFSGGEDRTIRHYNLEQMAYMDTLYGHQASVTSISCAHRQQMPISTSRDRTIRAWKLAQETHLIYRGGLKSMYAADCVSVLNSERFISGHDDGSIQLWSMDRKKPIKGIFHHDSNHTEIVSCHALYNSDLILSGSYNGYLNLWNDDLAPIGQVPIRGYINSIQVGKNARFCLLAVGQEHRLGRWNRVSRAKNRIGMVNLKPALIEIDDDNE